MKFILSRLITGRLETLIFKMIEKLVGSMLPNENIYHCDCLAKETLAIRKVDLFSWISIQMSREKRTFVSHVYFKLIEISL